MTSNLSAFAYIPERAEATPALWNNIFSILSANDAALNSNLTLAPPSGATLSLLSHLSISNRLAVGEKVHVGPAVSTSTNRSALLTLVGDMSNAGSGGTDYIYFNDSAAGKTSWLLGSGVADATDSLTFFNLSQSTPVIKLLPTSVQIGGGTPTPGAVSINQKNNQAGLVINQGNNPGSYAMLIQNGVMLGDVLTPMVLWLAQWVASGVSQTIFRINVTNTASHISSRLISLEVDGSDRFTVGVDGTLRSQGTNPRWRFTQGTFNVDATLDPSMYVASPTRTNPTIDSEGLYVQHRVTNNVGGSQVHDGMATEIRLSAVTNTNSAFLNALETSIVFAGGGSLVSDTRALTANLVVDSGVTGTVDNIALLRAQQKGALPGGFSIGTLASLWLESQTVATNNYTLYGPSGIARLGTVQVVGTGARGRLYLDGTGGVDTSILGFSLSSVTQFQIQHDNTNAKLYIIASGNTGITITANGAVGIRQPTPVGLTVSGYALDVNGAITTPDGSALVPSQAWNSEISLGLFRSANSNLALSYGTLNANTGVVAGGVIVATGGTPDETNSNTVVRLYGSRIQIFPGSSNPPWEMDNNSGTLRFFKPGTVYASLDTFGFQLTDGLAINPSYTFSSNRSLGFYSSGAQTVAQSQGTLNLATNQVRLSMRTLAASSVTASAVNTNVARNEVVFTIGGASGASLIISSGGTAYIFNSAASAILA